MPQNTNTWTNVEILAYAGQTQPASIPVTIPQGLQLAKGTVLGRVTASGKYAAYNDALSNGVEIATGILKENVDTTAVGTNEDTEASMYIEGNFIKSKLTGYDAAALADLNGREIARGGAGKDVFTFGGVH